MIHPTTKKQYIPIYPKMIPQNKKVFNLCNYCDLEKGKNCLLRCILAPIKRGRYAPVYKEIKPETN
jgi:hypothetical protein